MIRIRNMTYRIAGRTLFDSASASVPAGHKVGLVGRNGTGKSTLLKLLAGAAQPDAGELAIDGIAGIANAIGMVEQEAPSGTDSPLGFTLAADRERGTLLAEAENTHDPLRISEIQNRLADIGAHAAPARAASILAGLGFDDAEQHRPLSNFSGGWRMRVALAALLFTEPELLLLDEPTNHLDLEASLWLETHLRNYAKTLIVVSHDRELLNRSVTGILHLEAEKLTFYTGGYDRFAQVREERLALEEATARKQTLRRRHIQSFIDRFRYKASKARQAQSRLKALERMDAVSITAADPDTVFRFPQPDRLPPPLLSFERAAVGYVDGLPVLRNLDFRLDGEDRIGFLGRNGNGKSTLARLIAGRLPPMSGIMHRSPKLRIGFFTQHQIDDLVADDSPTAHMARLMPGAPPSRVRARLGGVGLTQDRQITPVKHLSGGEKARLTLALLMHDSPHVLILDEPTNHLDMDARDALVSAVNDFQGAVILISHDRRLMELSVDQLWLVADETVKPFDGDLTDYEAWTREARATSSNGGAGNAKRASPLSDGRANRRDTRRAGAERRRKNADIRKTVRDAERALERLAGKRNSLMKKLGNTAFYQEQSTQEIKNVILQKEAIDSAIETAEADWLAASESLDASE